MLEKISSYIGFAALFSFCITIIIFSYNFVRKCTEESKSKINAFINNGKYIPRLFTEILDSKEVLRYFVYSLSWKRRIVSLFNELYINHYGDFLKKDVINNAFIFKLPRNSTLETIKGNILKNLEFHKRTRHAEKHFIEGVKEKLIMLDICSFSYRQRLERLVPYCHAAESKNMLLKGSAGNGKTFLLCSISELIMKLGNPCIFIDAKDIKENSTDYFFKRLDMPEKYKDRRRLFLKLINLELTISKKYLFVIIDAINENDRQIFIDTLGDFINFTDKYNRIKILVSCRSEYFDIRYKKIFANNVLTPPYIYDIETRRFGYSYDRLIDRYKKHFSVEGELGQNIKNQIVKSLFIMRLFFETYQNTSISFSTINKYELFKKYIEKVSDIEQEINFRFLLEEIACKMIENHDFEQVAVNDLTQIGHSSEAFKRIADENLVIGRTLLIHSGIAQTEIEVIYFPFDELRDYCLARSIIKKCLDAQDANFTQLFELLNKFKVNYAAPLEGIIRYAYVYFKENEIFDHCRRILIEYVPIVRDSDRDLAYRRGELDENEYFSFGVSLIIDCNIELCAFEKEHIVKCLHSDPRDMVNVFRLIRGEIKSNTPKYSFDIFSIFFKAISEYSNIEYIVEKMFLSVENFETKLLSMLSEINNEDNKKAFICSLLVIESVSQYKSKLFAALRINNETQIILESEIDDFACSELKSKLIDLKEAMRKKDSK